MVVCLAVIATSTSNEEQSHGAAASPKQINQAMMLDPSSTSHAQQCGIDNIARGTVDPPSTKMARQRFKTKSRSQSNSATKVNTHVNQDTHQKRTSQHVKCLFIQHTHQRSAQTTPACIRKTTIRQFKFAALIRTSIHMQHPSSKKANKIKKS